MYDKIMKVITNPPESRKGQGDHRTVAMVYQEVGTLQDIEERYVVKHWHVTFVKFQVVFYDRH